MFVQLDTKTVYSFMDSLLDLQTYVRLAKEMGYEQIGIMDRENLYGAYHFIQEAKKAGLRPIVGWEGQLDYGESKLLVQLLALNSQGYQNLMKLSTEFLTGQTSLTYLSQYFQDLAVILPDQPGLDQLDFPYPYYIGLYLDSQVRDFTAPTLPLHTVRYISDQDRETLQVLHAIRDNLSLKDVPPSQRGQFLRPSGEMAELFRQVFPGSLEVLQELVSTIRYDFDQELKLPRFNRDRLAVEELRERAQAGLVDKGLWLPAYQDRLDYELGIIHDMGFDDYFLIVWDLLRFGRSQGYYMGMGRGSAAGSLVAYALDITGIDPVKNDLLFERFLNKERYSMPDIDIDLPDIYRSQFLHYVRDRYGSQHSAQIVTFSTFGARQAIRDVFKRFGATEYDLSNLTKKIGFRDNLTTAYERHLSFRQQINSRAEFQKAYAIAKKIEGQPRQTSIHAAGIVMSDDLLTDHIPLKAGEDMMVTQYDAPAVEANGLLKMDFLGLRNLTFVQKMQEKVAKDYGQVIDIAKIDLEDKATLALFAKGDTKGIFQFEQAGAINLLRRIKPARFEEVVATTSLNRPGASDYIENFINRKYGKEQVDLIDPLVAPILEPTYGIMLYQEQVMQIAQVFAGFSLGKADLLRRAMSKKAVKDMERMEADFLAGARDLGRDETVARDLFARMAKFAGYGFNRSHAYAYSALAFQLTYFKAHYPDVFYQVMLNYSSSSYITDALQVGFELVKPSINSIPYSDLVSQGKIILGLNHIKGLPRDLSQWIRNNRPYKNVEDFMTRLPEQYRKSNLILPLIQLGLFDELEPNRKKVEVNLEHLLVFAAELGTFFADTVFSWQEAEDYSDQDKYELEKSLIGIGLSSHPLLALAKAHRGNFTPMSDLTADSKVTVLGQIDHIKRIRTKSKGEQMAFLSLSDSQTKLEATLFPEAYRHYQDDLAEGKIFLFTGRTQDRDGRVQLLVQSLEEASLEKFWIQLANHDHDQQIGAILANFPGNCPVILRYEETKETLVSNQYRVTKSADLLAQLAPYVMKTIFR